MSRPSLLLRGALREHWPALALAAAAALLALWARHALFPAYSWNRDEPVYLWHVDMLRAGHLRVSDGDHPALFRPWLSAHQDGALFTQYTLGWPLVLLAAAVATGSAGNALLVGAALAVLGTYAIGLELLRDRRIATLGAALMVASPILPIQGGAYLSYLFTLGLGLLFGALLLSGLRLGGAWRPLLAGVLLGWIFMTRPYDAVLWAAAFGGYALLRQRSRIGAIARSVAWGAVGALPLVVATLAYNRHVTGGWLAFPITTADPMDTFGFGPKRLMPTFEIVDYGVGKALKATAKNFFVLPWFLVGSYIGAAAALAGLWQRRREPSTLALLLVCAVFPLGYFVFWGTHLSSLASRISGPIYLVPLYAPICLLTASVVVRWWSTRRRLAHGLLAALLLGTVPAAVTRFDVNRDISLQQVPWRESVESIDDRAIVFVADTAPYLLFINPFSANAPDLDGRILYAADGSPDMLDLIAEQPDRTPYLQQGTIAAPDTGPREDPADLDVTITPVDVRSGRTLTLTATIDAPTDASFVHVDVSTGTASHSRTLRVERSGPAPTVRLTLAAPGAIGDLSTDGRGKISVTLGWGATEAAAAAERVREEIVYRVAADRLEVLLPSAKLRKVLVDGDRVWRRSLALDQLRVDVTP
jgi:hypothetical protein